MKRLTEAGRAKLAESAPLWAQAQRRFEGRFGADKSAVLRRTLDIVATVEFEEALLRDGEEC